VVPIVLPPLRERRDDIMPLAEHFMHLAGSRKQLTAAGAARLREHSWPGNVRELRNVIERASVLVRTDVIDADDMDIAERAVQGLSRNELLDGDLPTAVAKLEAAMIRKALDACGGNRAEAARRLNINRQLLYTKMQRYGLGDVSGNPTPPVGKADT
jgi:DNA-binding NtrC family response regulator